MAVKPTPTATKVDRVVDRWPMLAFCSLPGVVDGDGVIPMVQPQVIAKFGSDNRKMSEVSEPPPLKLPEIRNTNETPPTRQRGSC